LIQLGLWKAGAFQTLGDNIQCRRQVLPGAGQPGPSAAGIRTRTPGGLAAIARTLQCSAAALSRSPTERVATAARAFSLAVKAVYAAVIKLNIQAHSFATGFLVESRHANVVANGKKIGTRGDVFIGGVKLFTQGNIFAPGVVLKYSSNTGNFRQLDTL